MTEAVIFVSGIMLRTVIAESGRMAFRSFIDGSARRTSIFNHYLAQARGSEHDKEWVDCRDGQCATL